jgi:hypothetical protein
MYPEDGHIEKKDTSIQLCTQKIGIPLLLKLGAYAPANREKHFKMLK